MTGLQSKKDGSPWKCFKFVDDRVFRKSKDKKVADGEYFCFQFPLLWSSKKCCQYCPMKNLLWPCFKAPMPGVTNDERDGGKIDYYNGAECAKRDLIVSVGFDG